MASGFSGTQAKCKSCGQTVFPMEQLVAEGVIFHKGCFRCSHCKSTLKLENYVSLEGVFYCKPHFHSLFQATGSYAKSFDSAIKTEKETPPPPGSTTGDAGSMRHLGEKKEPSPMASKFGGTQEKCLECGKTVYPIEKIMVESNPYHTGCFKCVKGGCTLTSASFKSHQGKLYCKHHFQQLFLKKGNFSTMQDGAEGEGHSPLPSPGKAPPAAAFNEMAAKSPAPAASSRSPATPGNKPAEDDEDDE